MQISNLSYILHTIKTVTTSFRMNAEWPDLYDYHSNGLYEHLNGNMPKTRRSGNSAKHSSYGCVGGSDSFVGYMGVGIGGWCIAAGGCGRVHGGGDAVGDS